MARFVNIGDRLLNVDQVLAVERIVDRLRGAGVVVRFTDPSEPRDPDEAAPLSANIAFFGSDAEFVWSKLADGAEDWAIPSRKGKGAK